MPTITVCNKCLCACCWQGEFMCEEARHAGTVEMTRDSLAALDPPREHPDYWDADERMKAG